MKISRRAASRRSEVSAFRAMDVMQAAAALEASGRRVIHMEVGQPSGGLPSAARAALESALDEPLGYTVALGTDPLRQAIAALTRTRYGVDIDPARVIVTTGSSAAFQLAFLALFDHGDRLAMADPSYPSYRNIAQALGLEPVRLEATEETRFQPTAELLEAAGPVDGLLVASPANPTGTMLSREDYAALAGAVAEMGGALISDEIYHGLHYATPAVSALEVDDGAIVINSFSKYFAMTGWRIGWMIAPEDLVRPIERLAQNLYICPPHAAQRAALGALSPEAGVELEARRQVYAANRSILLEALPTAGITHFAPADGAFYLYADLTDLLAGVDEDSAGWCARLLEEEGVATTPGWDFDTLRGGKTVRLSFAGPTDAMTEGAERIARFIRKG